MSKFNVTYARAKSGTDVFVGGKLVGNIDGKGEAMYVCLEDPRISPHQGQSRLNYIRAGSASKEFCDVMLSKFKVTTVIDIFKEVKISPRVVLMFANQGKI